jgi:N-methylhydantoinase A
MSTARFRVGLDSGGTFTDIVVLDSAERNWRLYKVLSQHDNPEAILTSALEKASAGAGLEQRQFVEQTEIFVIGTTVATNALLQHRGAKVGLLGTSGHTDSVEIREGHKEDGHRYDWSYPQATILAPRNLRVPIEERVLADGSERTPLSREQVKAAAELFKREEVDTIALSFLFSFLDETHEREAAEILAAELPDVPVTVAHELLPMIGDYNRVSTVVLNAYVQPGVRRFIGGMEDALEAVGFNGPVRYFQANGGMASGKSLVPKAIYALNSGPAAAPTAGAAYARMYDRDAITIDAGGTSLDVGLVHGTTTDISLTSDVARYRIGIPMVNIETLGAGGGSIAWFDSRGILSVGPQSAESRPGPACYKLGGERPTVTDALVALGWFNQEALLGGEMEIDASASLRAIETDISEPTGMSVDEAAEGIIRVATNNMVGGIRRISVERGYDPRDAVLVAIGGSGPAFGCRIAEELQMETVVVPRVASGFCAFGAAIANIRHDFVATYSGRLDQVDLTRLNEIVSGLERAGREELVGEGVEPDSIAYRRSFEMRYLDQVHNTLVETDLVGEMGPAEVDRLRQAFDDRHEELYTYSEPDNAAMLVNVHVSVTGTTVGSGEAGFAPAESPPRPDGADATRTVYLGAERRREEIPIVGVADFHGGADEVAGPAVIEETTTTIVLPPGWTAKLDPRGHYELRWER